MGVPPTDGPATDAEPVVAVVGSLNLDIVAGVPQFPRPGETLLGTYLQQVPGGKGLNQAMAAAAASVTHLIGCIGDDEAGSSLLRRLRAAGVGTSQLRSVPGSTGRALIQVTPDAENTVVVLALANAELDSTSVAQSLDDVRPDVVLAQLEIALETVTEAAGWAGRHGARFVLNASPVRRLPQALLEACDPVVVNVDEAAALLGHEDGGPRPATGAPELARALASLARSAVVTEGPRGVHVADGSGWVAHLPAKPVQAVDTTGAGDEFAGVLASTLARGETLENAARLANHAAAHLVQVPRDQR